MKKFIYSIVFILTAIISCNQEKHQFPLDKRYWDVEDYKKVVLELNYGYEVDEQLPSFSNPSTRLIIEKLTDHRNYEIVLYDKELGLKYKNNIAESFFNVWKDMQKIYQGRNVQDKYLYDEELLKVWQFGLGLQLVYFQLGNDEILANSLDPSDRKVQFHLKNNIETLIDNFSLYLNELNNENAYSEEGKRMYSEGISIYFNKLVEMNPEGDYSKTIQKIDLLEKKIESNTIKNSLLTLKDKLVSIENNDQ